MTGRKPEGGSSESESEAEDGAGKSPGKKVLDLTMAILAMMAISMMAMKMGLVKALVKRYSFK